MDRARRIAPARMKNGKQARAVESRPGGGATPRSALVLTGGGARAAYQVGFLRCLANRMPASSIPIITGVSAGAINAASLAARPGSLAEAVDRLSELWRELTPDRVFRVGTLPLVGNFLRWGWRLVSAGSGPSDGARSLVDTSPLRDLLRKSLGTVDGLVHGIGANLERGRLQAFALSALDYGTGRTVTWVQGCRIPSWERPNRVGVNTRITVDHIMASAALPLLFPAVRIGGSWYGDGGIRMFAPLAPAIHLGADRILAISTRYGRNREEAATPAIDGYPPAAQVAGTLLNAVFLDAFDHDAMRLERINRLLSRLPESDWDGHRIIRLLVLRPSVDLGRLAADFEVKLPRAFRFLTRGLGTHETRSPDFLSLLMFQRDYLSRLIEIGEADAEARAEEIGELLAE